ncbi:hypothetical protein ACFE04_029941 [Oxalis oulophora]
MSVSIESSIWSPSPSIYIFFFISSTLSILLFPHFTKQQHNNNKTSLFDASSTSSSSSSFRRFQRNFLFLYTLSSVMDGLWSVFGEFELVRYGFDKEDIVFYLSVGYAASFFIGTLLGPLSDILGHKRICLLFCVLQLVASIWKKISSHPSIWVANICLSLASSVFYFCFETWAVVEHEKLEHGQDALSDTFWLMTFFESASLIGSQEWYVSPENGRSVTKQLYLRIIECLSIPILLRSWINKNTQLDKTLFVSAGHGQTNNVFGMGTSLSSVLSGSLLATMGTNTSGMADGREVLLGLLFPCFLGARMLGSTMFPWMVSGPLSIRTEDCLQYAFIFLGLVFAIIAYDYQEIGFLTTLFCLFNCCVGLVLPSLARLRTMYVPNELRGGMMSLSNAPAYAAILIFLVQRGYHNNIENSTLIASASIGLFMAAELLNYRKDKSEGDRKLRLSPPSIPPTIVDYGSFCLRGISGPTTEPVRNWLVVGVPCFRAL